MKRDIKVYIGDILDSIAKIEEYTKSISKGDFYKNTQVQDAVFRRLEIIGEAVKNIPQDFKNKYPEITWKNCRDEGYTYPCVFWGKYRTNLEGC